MTITVETRPQSSVAYHATYAGEEGGAEPPFGHGHGGNDAGTADGSGRYTSAWIVKPSAPTGPARVDVVVAIDGGFGETEVAFEVADPLMGGCGGGG